MLGLGVKWDLFSVILLTTIEPSTPEFSAIWRIGCSSPVSRLLWSSNRSRDAFP
jgi:hypothetical protein